MISQSKEVFIKRRFEGIFFGIILLTVSGISWPATGVGGDGYWWGSAINPGYNRKTVIQVEGTVKSISLESAKGMASLLLETKEASYQVMIAPGWYLKDLQWDIQSGDLLEVEGSRMTDTKGKLFLVASRITNRRTGSLFKFRDDQGNPLWRGERSPRRFLR